MQIKRLVIENFKSIERIELIEPNPFTVFVGPNGSGKSNIFEALEFGHRLQRSLPEEALSLFGGINLLARRGNETNSTFHYLVDYDDEPWHSESSLDLAPATQKRSDDYKSGIVRPQLLGSVTYELRLPSLFDSFSRVAAYEKEPRINFQGDSSLNTAASNLEPVLKRVLSDPVLKEEIFEWLSLFVPGFQAVDVVKNTFDGGDMLLWYEDSTDQPFTKTLISDGTYNILTMLTAVYQKDDTPQFLCIEEPENGLHPKVARELMDFFRLMCEERGHYIWVNTHSPYMASRVKPAELVTVNKIDGTTRIKQFGGMNWHGLTADEAWLSNVLGSGNPW